MGTQGRAGLASAVAVGAATLGIAAMAASSRDAWSVAALWALGACAVSVALVLIRGRLGRLAVAFGLLAGCVLLGWVGGLFMLPAALAVVAIGWETRHE